MENRSPQPPQGRRQEQGQPGEDPEERPVSGQAHQRPAGEDPGGRPQRQPEIVRSVFPVGVASAGILVIKAVDRNVEDVVGHPENEKEPGHEPGFARQPDEDEDGTLRQEGSQDHALHREPVVRPAGREGEDERRQAVAGGDDADLEAAEAEFEEMERGQKKGA